jgi:hypothetical protein
LPVAYCLLPVAYCLPAEALSAAKCEGGPIDPFPLPIAYCQLRIARLLCPLPIAYCELINLRLLKHSTWIANFSHGIALH